MSMICVWFGKGLKCFGLRLDIRFSTYGVTDAFKIVYPQYWLWLDCEASFAKHLEVCKTTFWCGEI